MKPDKVLERLDAARRAIAALPEDANVLQVQVDGLQFRDGDINYDRIQIYTPFEDLAEAGVIEPDSWDTEDDPGRKVLEDRALICGFPVIRIKERGQTAGGGSGEENL